LDLIKQFNALWHLVKKLEIPPEVESADQNPQHDRQGNVARTGDSLDSTGWLGIDPLGPESAQGHLEDSLEAVKDARSKVAENRTILSKRAAAIAAGI